MTAFFDEDQKWQFFAVKSGADLAGVNVSAFDQAQTEVVTETTDAQGTIPQQIVRDTAYSVTGTTETPTANTPHRIIASKYGERIFAQDIPLTEDGSTTHFFEADPFITETVPATVDAYTGITFNHVADTLTTDGTGITPVNTTDRLYDRTRREADTTKQYDYPRGIIGESPDGLNYNPIEYDWIVDGYAHDGQSRNFNFATGKGLTIQGAGAAVDDLAVTADVTFSTGWDGTTVTNLDVTGDVDLSNGGTPRTISVSGCAWGSVSSTTSGWVLNLVGGSSIATNNDPGNIQVNNSKIFTVTGLQSGERVVWLTRPGEVELENQPESGGQASYTYNYTVDTDIWISILSVNRFIELREAQLLNQDQTINAGLRDDPFFSNPT